MPLKVDLTPDSLDLVLYAGDGADFQINFEDDTGNPIDVSSYTWTSQIRKSRNSSEHIDLSIDASLSSTGVITVLIPPAVTRSLGESNWNNERQWDIQCVVGAGDPHTVLQGTVYCSQDVTR